MAGRRSSFLTGLIPGRRVRHSPAWFGTRRDPLIWVAMVASPAVLAAGLWLPALRIERPVAFGLFDRTDHLSVAGGIASLWVDGDFLLAAPIILVAMVFPGLRIIQAWRLWRRTGIAHRRFDRRLVVARWFGWWSLAEAAAITMFIPFARFREAADFRPEPGLYLIAAGLAGIALALFLVGGSARRLRGRGIVEYPE